MREAIIGDVVGSMYETPAHPSRVRLVEATRLRFEPPGRARADAN